MFSVTGPVDLWLPMKDLTASEVELFNKLWKKMFYHEGEEVVVTVIPLGELVALRARVLAQDEVLANDGMASQSLVTLAVQKKRLDEQEKECTLKKRKLELLEESLCLERLMVAANQDVLSKKEGVLEAERKALVAKHKLLQNRVLRVMGESGTGLDVLRCDGVVGSNSN